MDSKQESTVGEGEAVNADLDACIEALQCCWQYLRTEDPTASAHCFIKACHAMKALPEHIKERLK